MLITRRSSDGSSATLLNAQSALAGISGLVMASVGIINAPMDRSRRDQASVIQSSRALRRRRCERSRG
jgi:hypothetical protein